MVRNRFLGVVLSLALAAIPARVAAQEAAPSPDEALKRLKEGNARFIADMLKEAGPPSKQRVATAADQRPIAMILTCADSRSTPEYIFDKGIGVLFVLRVAGNVGGTDVYASMEYGAAVLKSPLIVVLGHSNCGAVDAAFKGKDLPTENLKNLVKLIQIGDKPKDLDVAIRTNVLAQADLIPKQSPLLKDFIASGRVKIVSAIYDLKTGEVSWLETPKK